MSSLLSDKFRNEITWNGYSIDVIKSGLQKYIRRGILNKALYCAAELDLFKECPERGETLRTNFLHRLIIIFCEDVANMAVFIQVYNIIDKLFNERQSPSRNKDKEERLLSELIQLLTTSPKARICSHVRAIFNPSYHIPKLLDKYPTIKTLIDKIDQTKPLNLHTSCKEFTKYLKEKSILSVYYAFKIHYSTETLSIKCYNKKKPAYFIFNELAKYMKSNIIDKFRAWYSDHIGQMREGFLAWLLPLLHYIDVVPHGEELQTASPTNWDVNRRGEKIVIDDYVEDRHTRIGHSKTNTEFALNGAYVANEAPFINKLWKAFYEDGKRFEDGLQIIGECLPSPSPIRKIHIIRKETSAYRFVVRTQLNTSASKMDVYFAHDNQTNKLVVVKGPYQNSKQIHVFEENMRIKQKLDLPIIPYTIRKLIPDRWDSIPLGARNNVDRSKPAEFIIFDSLIPLHSIKTKIHSSKLWPPTEVVDWTQIPLHFNYTLASEEQALSYIRAVLYRYIFGISDLADRNFLLYNNTVISIDEDIVDNDINLYNELKKNKAQWIYNWIADNYSKLLLNTWEISNINEKYHSRMQRIMNKETCMNLFTA